MEGGWNSEEQGLGVGKKSWVVRKRKGFIDEEPPQLFSLLEHKALCVFHA